VIGAVGREYLYQPGASDADPDDVLTFSLPTKPFGMAIDPATGRVTWTPTTPQIGEHEVQLVVDDGHFGSASQAWTIEVFSTLPNQPPVIDSVPTTFAIVGTPYLYDAHAVDRRARPSHMSWSADRADRSNVDC
jgi:hypothetical protein